MPENQFLRTGLRRPDTGVVETGQEKTKQKDLLPNGEFDSKSFSFPIRVRLRLHPLPSPAFFAVNLVQAQRYFKPLRDFLHQCPGPPTAFFAFGLVQAQRYFKPFRDFLHQVPRPPTAAECVKQKNTEWPNSETAVSKLGHSIFFTFSIKTIR